MSNTEVLNEKQLDDKLSEFVNWKMEGLSIVREISTANFASAVGIINAIAILAEKADHHPDMLIYGWNKVRMTLSTHDKGGLTEKDFALAKEIDSLKF